MKCETCGKEMDDFEVMYSDIDNEMEHPLCAKCLKKQTESGKPDKPTRRKRVVKNPAQYCIFRVMRAADVAERNPDDIVLVGVAVAKGPAIARKEVVKQKISGEISCYRGPIWNKEFGVQQVFGEIKK